MVNEYDGIISQGIGKFVHIWADSLMAFSKSLHEQLVMNIFTIFDGCCSHSPDHCHGLSYLIPFGDVWHVTGHMCKV